MLACRVFVLRSKLDASSLNFSEFPWYNKLTAPRGSGHEGVRVPMAGRAAGGRRGTLPARQDPSSRVQGRESGVRLCLSLRISGAVTGAEVTEPRTWQALGVGVQGTLP